MTTCYYKLHWRNEQVKQSLFIQSNFSFVFFFCFSVCGMNMAFVECVAVLVLCKPLTTFQGGDGRNKVTTVSQTRGG